MEILKYFHIFLQFELKVKDQGSYLNEKDKKFITVNLGKKEKKNRRYNVIQHNTGTGIHFSKI